MNTFKKHPTNVLRSKGKISRVHALEIARRAMEKGGEGGDMMPLTAAEMPNPFSRPPQDPTSQWPQMMGAPGGAPLQDPFGGMMGGGGNGTPQ